MVVELFLTALAAVALVVFGFIFLASVGVPRLSLQTGEFAIKWHMGHVKRDGRIVITYGKVTLTNRRLILPEHTFFGGGQFNIELGEIRDLRVGSRNWWYFIRPVVFAADGHTFEIYFRNPQAMLGTQVQDDWIELAESARRGEIAEQVR